MAFVIGTAGHIDHGKTLLVRWLTGQDTDRLKAEKQRGISIDLGFAHFTLPGDISVGVVDVPGHERFIRNMVAGAHGFDLVLFVIAADDGVMPQTEEHFDILCSLGIERAIFVITKVDMVADGRFDEVAEEIEILVDGSRFEGVKILPVSNATGDGIDVLCSELAQALQESPQAAATGKFRMPIDRVFNVHGRGVVITGTQIAGVIDVGDEVAIVPGGASYRVRGLQSHGVDVARGQAGDRLAINLTGAEMSGFHRGDVACDPAIAIGAHRLDVAISVAAHAAHDLKHGQRLRLHLGTAERAVTVFLLGEETVLQRGEDGLAQLRLRDPVQVMAHDRFVLRDEQAEHTLGGGVVLDPDGPKIRRDDPHRLGFLTALQVKDMPRALERLLDGVGGLLAGVLQVRLNLTPQDFQGFVKANPSLVLLGKDADVWITSLANLERLQQGINRVLADYHASNPTSDGPGGETLHHQSVAKIDLRLFRLVLDHTVKARLLTRLEGSFALPSHRAGLTPSQEEKAAIMLAAIEAEPFSPPGWDVKNPDEKAIIAYLEQRGKLVRVAPGLAFAKSAYETADQRLEVHLLEIGDITPAQFRDLLGNTRKYALALLETFDRKGRTIRNGDVRKRGKPLADTP
ncbi:MAG: selenocysteine-specific elongation factor [Paracoccaceae bacterium]|jgi:selenocysteine-specific elongation factor